MRQWPKQRTIVYPSPFSDSSLGLEPSERKTKEEEFLALFRMSVEAEADSDEEAWAYYKLKELYGEWLVSDRMPGFFDAMRWAAQATSGPASR